MSERDKKRGRSGCAILLVVLLLPVLYFLSIGPVVWIGVFYFPIGLLAFLPVMYVLSIGPAVWMADHFGVVRNAFVVIYYPLICLAGCGKLFQDALNWYMDLWSG